MTIVVPWLLKYWCTMQGMQEEKGKKKIINPEVSVTGYRGALVIKISA